MAGARIYGSTPRLKEQELQGPTEQLQRLYDAANDGRGRRTCTLSRSDTTFFPEGFASRVPPIAPALFNAIHVLLASKRIRTLKPDK
jgi:hypothetical protein